MHTAQATDVTANLRVASPEIMEMHSLITKMGFIMMGATHIRFSNQQYLLAWSMGSGAKCVAINMFYRPGLDLYTLDFIKSHSDSARTVRMDRVYGEDVIGVIERETGFYLRL
ncbi:hypothetical protein [Spirosoma sp.]|uniref:hypothetical protein n=1 Tax=Spirosoma sp. TaxID=1899569 RepID=UPI0026286B50|nr:hypothetical protein [Spirosoma sp.]MCX6213746.1 hypothetical protein [Spirosoma sp.]